MRLSLIGIAAVLALGLVACSETREEKFEKALRGAEAAQKVVESARKEVETELAKYEKASAAAESAEKRLSKARAQLDSAESSAAKARAEVAKWADDATVFRTVQRRLLEEKSLGEAAVSARVQGGVAYLEGRVPNEKARERAIQIARETPGVLDVQSQIGVGSVTATTPSIAPAPVPEPVPTPAPVEAFPAEPEPVPAEAAPAPIDAYTPEASDVTPAEPESAMPPDRHMHQP